GFGIRKVFVAGATRFSRLFSYSLFRRIIKFSLLGDMDTRFSF
ncbi:hypothetical protein HMPREF3038_02886, partial [Akkermansia sp. KLE1797]